MGGGGGAGLCVLERVRLRRRMGGFKGLIDGSFFLALVLSPHALLQHNLLFIFFLLTPFSLLYLSIFPSPPPFSSLLLPLPTSYHLGQATWPIGEYGNQLEADNN